jgi:deoxyribonuclease V
MHDPAKDLIRAADIRTAHILQEMLRHFCIYEKTIATSKIRFIAGADAAYTQEHVCAAVVVMEFPRLDIVDSACTVQEIPFPYIPGLLSFREGPAIIDAVDMLARIPDLIFLNGHGYSHPRRIGIASHVGIILDIPAIGVSQRLLTGTTATPGKKHGSIAQIVDDHEVIGLAVRTKEGTNPVYISAGHKMDLSQALEIVLKTVTVHRLPEPLWYADRLSRQLRKELSQFTT